MSDEIQIRGEPSTTGERCKFTVDRPLVPNESAFFSDSASAAAVSPLAGDLLALPGVVRARRGQHGHARVRRCDRLAGARNRPRDPEAPADWSADRVGELL